MKTRLLQAVVVAGCFFSSALIVGMQVSPARAASVVWDGGGTTNDWSEAANWTGDTLPTSDDVAYFNATSTKNVSIDVETASLAGFQIQAAYTGTITQEPGIIIHIDRQSGEGAGFGYNQAGGTFVGGDSYMRAKSFTQTGGTFTATSDTTEVNYDFTVSGGTFNHNNGTFAMGGADSTGTFVTWDVPTTLTFYNLNATGKCGGGGTNMGSGDTFVIMGLFTFTCGQLNNGTIDLRGNATVDSSGGGGPSGSATMQLGNDSVSQTITVTSSEPLKLVLDSAADASDHITITNAATFNYLQTTSGFSGTIPFENPSDFVATFSTWNEAGGSYDASAQTQWNLGNFTLGAGASFVPPETTVASGTWDVQTLFTFDADRFFTLANLSIASGDTIAVLGQTTCNGSGGLDGAGTLDVEGALSHTSSGCGGSGTMRIIGSARAITLASGSSSLPRVILNSAGTTIAANSSSTLSFGANSSNSLTVTAGTFNGSSGDISFSNRLLVNGGDMNFGSGSATVSVNGVVVSSGTLTFGSGTLTLNVTGSGDFTQSGGTVNSGIGTLSLRGDFTLSGGTFNAPAVISIGTDWTHTGAGTWNANGGTVIFDGTGFSGATVNVNTTETFYNITKSGADTHTAITFGDTIIATGTLTLTDGNFDNGTVEAQGPVTHTSTFDGGLGTILVTGTPTIALIAGGQMPALTLNNAGATVNGPASGTVTFDKALTIQNGSFVGAAGSLDINSDLIISGGSFQAPSGTTFVLGNFTHTTGGTFDPNGGTVVFDGGGATIDVATTETFNNLTINATSFGTGQPKTVASGDTLIVPGTLTLTDGSINTGTVEAQAAVSHASTFDGGNGTILITGSARTISATAGDLWPGVIAGATGVIFDLPATGSVDFGGNTGAQDGGLWNGDASTVTVHGDVIIGSGGTVQAPSSTLTLGQTFTSGADWRNLGGTFVHNSGEVIVIGSSQFIGGSTTFNDFTYTPYYTGIALEMTMEAGSTQTVLGTFTLKGLPPAPDEQMLFLRSSTPGSYAYIDPQGTRDIEYVDVQDNSNINAAAINCVNSCVDSGHNVNWFFGLIVTESGDSTDVAEEGTTSDDYSIVLTQAPTDDVVIDITGNADVSLDSYQLIFTSSNWDVPQTVTVTAVDDVDDETDPETVTISHNATSLDPAYDGVFIDDVAVSVSDNDLPYGITYGESSGSTSVSEQGETSDSYTIVLNRVPTDDVVIDLSFPAGDFTTDVSELTFTPSNWFNPQTVTVTAVDDPDDEADLEIIPITHTLSSTDPGYDGLTSDLNVNVIDDESIVNVSLISGDTTEAGGTATFTVTLGEYTDYTIIYLHTDDGSEGNPDQGYLYFDGGNWNIPQTVTVTGADDGSDDGDVTYHIVLDPIYDTFDFDYYGVDPGDVTVVNIDDDSGGGGGGGGGGTGLRNGTITVVKQVINDNGGIKNVSDFPLFVNGDPVTSGVAYTYYFYSSGIFNVTESNSAGYRASFSGDCDSKGSIDLQPGENAFCTITNDDTGEPVTELYSQAGALASATTINIDKSLAPPANPTGRCVSGSLLKLADDGDLNTQVDSTVYYCGADENRYDFPNPETYFSWYADFSPVQIVSPEALAALPLVGNVTERPGTRMLKIQSDPKAYAIARGGILRWVMDESVAAVLYGAQWNQHISDVTDGLFNSSYRIGDPIDLTEAISQ